MNQIDIYEKQRVSLIYFKCHKIYILLTVMAQFENNVGAFGSVSLF